MRDPSDAYRIGLAETLLDDGFSPFDLLKELGLDPTPPRFRKYDADQPRVPAGRGRASGRWGGGDVENVDPVRLVVDKSGRIYFTNNHYRSFYPVDIKTGASKK